MVLISAIMAIFVTNMLFLTCLLVAFRTAEHKRNLELRRLRDRYDRLAEQSMTPTERARRVTRRRRADERHRRTLDGANE
ncbi:MAG: hypothetical protein ACR2QO_22065 [Acidimicrobiales bacterium]